MKKKKNKQYTFFTVGELKQLLSKIRDDLPVGLVGHFGEFRRVYRSDFHIGKAKLVPDGEGWRSMDDYESDVFIIPEVDLGPCPD